MSSAVRALFTKSKSAPHDDASRERGAVYCNSSSAYTPSYKPRYKVDLAAQHAECELNYVRLCKVLVDHKTRDSWQFHVGQHNLAARFIVEVIDRARYTTTLVLRQEFDHAHASVVSPVFTVRLYHDATMAEVIAWEDHRRLRARYETPNTKMYHADEKSQLNQFLSDWLVLCQSQGRASLDLAAMGIHPR